jgi:hypothetical protein
VNNLYGGNAAIREIELVMLDSFLGKISSLVGLVIKANHASYPQLLKDGHVIVRGKDAILGKSGDTSYLSLGLSEGELKATNLFGMIQFKSPFSIF